MVWETGRSVPSFEEEVTDAGGDRRILLSSKSPLRNAEGLVTGILTTSVDITERKLAENHLQHMALHDTLTGLPNRVALNDRINRGIARARRGDRPFALHVIDIDNFKAINDVGGHAGGDRFIVQIGQRLKDTVRRGDVVARIGGDEFAVLQAHVGRTDEVKQFAEKLLEAVAKPVIEGNDSIYAAASIGSAWHPADGDTAEALLGNADTAMHRAKSEGGAKARLYASDMQAVALANAKLDAELRNAVEGREFVLYFQPQVDAQSRKVVGGEALIRWNKPGLGIQSPAAFLPRAESTGAIVQINEWVVMEACRAAHRWQKLGLQGVRVGVNLSPVQFVRQNVPLLVARALGESGLDPKLLDLEITESSVLEDSETLIAELEQLRTLGCEISIDDFGTGYSSLRYVKRFPVDRLKLDQSFIRNLPHDPNDVAIVKTVMALGHSLDLSVIAEGVETQAQADFLRAEGCDEFQGYLYAKPMPFDDFIAFASGAIVAPQRARTA
jgi:diguanylate cyclase (GGDEF)-like protein